MRFRVAVIGLGYFSQFHLAGWHARPDVDHIAICDQDIERAKAYGAMHSISAYTDAAEMCAQEVPDVVDIIIPPSAHKSLISKCLKAGRTLICQKPFCTSLEEAKEMTALAEAAGTRLVIHENFRFQPWHREIKEFLGSDRMGRVYQARFDLRPGDGRGPRAYLDRQPIFQQMPRLLVHETAVHFLDLFRFFFGPMTSLYADLRRLNPVIAGEDAGHLICHHDSGVVSVFDGNRLSDHVAENPRLTMGEMVIEAEGGQLTLDGHGHVRFRTFGAKTDELVPLSRPVDTASFGGGCTAALIDHVIEALRAGNACENEAEDYLAVVAASEAAYRSAEEGRRISLS